MTSQTQNPAPSTATSAASTTAANPAPSHAPSEPGVVITHADGVCSIVLNRPAKLNPLGPAEWDAIVSAIVAAEADPNCRAITLSSTGRYFCAGNDLSAMRQLHTHAEYVQYFGATLLRGFIHLLTTPLPVICLIHADTAGGGLELALYSDYVVAHPEVNLALPENLRGLFAATLVATAPSGWSRSAMAALAFTGAPISARRAQELGIVHELAPDLVSARERILAGIKASAPDSLAATKQYLNRNLIEQGLPAVAQAIITLADQLTTGNGAEGLAAFAAKTEPVWQQRRMPFDLDRRAELLKTFVGEADV